MPKIITAPSLTVGSRASRKRIAPDFGDGLGPVLTGLVREAHNQLRMVRRNGTPGEQRNVGSLYVLRSYR